MANRAIPRVKIDAKILREYLEERGITITSLAKAVDYSDRTIRRGLNDGAMTSWLVNAIAEELDISRDYFVVE